MHGTVNSRPRYPGRYLALDEEIYYCIDAAGRDRRSLRDGEEVDLTGRGSESMFPDASGFKRPGGYRAGAWKMSGLTLESLQGRGKRYFGLCRILIFYQRFRLSPNHGVEK